MNTTSVLQLLAEVALKSTILLALCAAATQLLRRSSAAWKHALWIAAITASLLLIVISGRVPEWRVVPAPSIVYDMAADTGSIEPALRVSKPAPSHVTPKETAAKSGAPAQIRDEVSTVSTPVTAATAAPIAKPVSHFDPRVLLVCLWAAGAFVVAARYAVSSLRLRRLAAASHEVTDASWNKTLRAARKQIGIAAPVLLLESDKLHVPIVWGALRPRVIIPVGAHSWSMDRRWAVLLHELAHVKRFDAWTQIVTQIATALYWFNPLLWYAAAQARFLRERACDDYVLRSGPAPSAYAQELLAIVSQIRSSDRYAAALAMARRSQFEGRLLSILDPRMHRRALSRVGLSVIMLCAVAIMLPSAALKWKFVEVAQAAQADVAKRSAAEPAPAAEPGAFEAAAAQMASTSGTLGASGAAIDDAMSAAQSEAQASTQSSAAPTPIASDSPLLRKLAACQTAKSETTSISSSSSRHESSNMSIIDDDGKHSWIVKWTRGDCSINLNSEGKIKFNDDFTAVSSISPGGWVDMTMRVGGETQRARFEPAGGNVHTQYWRNGKEVPMDAEAWAWVRDFAIVLDRQTAFAVDYRFPKLMKEGGPSRVLQEVAAMTGDYAQAIYLMRLVQQVDLNANDLDRAIQATQRMSSDYETARVLMAVAAKYDLNAASTRATYLQALDKLKSDYEHARVLMTFFDKTQVPPELARTVLASAAKIKSDYELGRVLIQMASKKMVTPAIEPDYVATIGKLKSDYEHARTLTNYLDIYGSDAKRLGPVIEQVSQIKSDYEASRVLQAIAAYKPEGQLREAYIRIANGIQSEYERKRALAAIGYRMASY
jgi:beta-lactamase regulating signal transducer with metallopeptidase domain